MSAPKPGTLLGFSGAQLADSLRGHQFVVTVDGERCTVEVTGEASGGELVAKVVVP